MLKVRNVGSVQKAVELAQDLMAKGVYNWFRGQVRDWAPVSSLHRLLRDGDQAAIERVRKRYQLLREWLSENPTLRYLLDDEHIRQFYAVAQHYSIPTHYIDFTTDPAVAGFFAADTESPPTDGMSCIYCLNTKDLLAFAEDLKAGGERDDTSIDTVEVDVTNLWRLQAQRGVFLFSQYNWDIDYPMDRILFPYTGCPSYPTHDYIYPKEKSALELLLDQYFDLEKKYFGNNELREFVANLKLKGGNASVIHMKSFPGGINEKAFVDPAGLTPPLSWSRSRQQDWQIYPDERYHDVRGHIERIYLNGPDQPSLMRAIAFGVKQVLDAQPQNRAKLIEWTLEGATGDLATKRVCALFRDTWNGMRSLPFSNDQIAAAFSVIAGLVSIGFGAGPQPKDDEDSFSKIRGDGLCVEFAYADRSSSIGYVNKEALRSAMRSDLKSLVVPEYHNRMDELTSIFRMVQNPTLLFNFEPLVDIFARDLIPSQIVVGREPTLFNPAALAIFGLP